MEPVQLNIGLKAEVSRKLLNPRSDLQIRARYMKRAVPLDLHPIKDQLETEVVPSLDTASSCGSLHEDTAIVPLDLYPSENHLDAVKLHCSFDSMYEDTTMLVTLHIEKIISAGEAFQPGLLILELWRHRTVVHSVPVLLVAGKDQELMWEWSTKPGAPKHLGNSGLLQEQTIRAMGLWLEFVTTLKAEQCRQAPHLNPLSDDQASHFDPLCDEQASHFEPLCDEQASHLEPLCDEQASHLDLLCDEQASHFDPLCDELKKCMLKRAAILLMSATYRGWLYTASEVLEGLLVDCALKFEDLVVADSSNRQTLLHAAVMSGKAYMVAAVIQWGDENCRRWRWTVQNNRGVTPLHMVACSGNTKLAASILTNFSQAREAWNTCKGKLGYTPAAQADKISRRTREMSPSLDAQGCDSLRKEPEKIVRCASPLSGGLPRATSLSRASRPAASIEKGVVPAIDSMHTDSGGLPRATSLSRASRTAASIEKGVVPATDSMHTDSGGLPRATSLSRASRAAASIEKGVVPATDSMHVEKGLVPATDSMHVEKGVVPATHSMHVEKKVVPATDSMHVEKGVVPATDSMHVEKKVAPATDSMHVDKGGVPATDSMHIEKGRVPATDSMHVEKGVVPATDSMHIEKGRVPATDSMHIKKGVVPATDSMHIEKEVVPATDNMYEKGEVPAPGAGPCPPTSSRDGTCSSSETEITDKDATTAMSQILEGGRSCSAFDENALKGMKSVPEADPCPPTSSRADTRIISETSMTGKDATTAMHQILEGGRSCSAFDENALKGMVPAPEADPCPPTSSPADTHISSEISMMNKDATTAMPQILEEGRLCSAFDKHALDEAVLKGKGELAKAEAAELNSQVKSSSLRETVKSLVLRLGLKFKRKPNSLHPKSITPIQ